MIKMTCFLKLILFCCIFAGQSLFGQSDNLDFPAKWTGKYMGELEIFNSKGLTQKLPMELHILPIDTSDNYSWTIIYGEDKVAGKRDYEIVPVHPEYGLYQVDEKNSIVIEGNLIGNAFYQRFEVMNTMLLSVVERISENELSWSIISGGAKEVSTTGGETIDNEEIPPVSAYSVLSVQKAILVKQ